MATDAIVLGDPRGLLRRGPAELQEVWRWTKRDSDIIAHFLQVYTQIRGSSWYSSDKKFTVQGSKILEASMPDLEQFVFAAVYFRQLTMEKDNLLQDAVERYCSQVACPIRKDWIKLEAEAFNNQLESPPFPLKKEKRTQLVSKDRPTAGRLASAFGGLSPFGAWIDSPSRYFAGPCTPLFPRPSRTVNPTASATMIAEDTRIPIKKCFDFISRTRPSLQRKEKRGKNHVSFFAN